MWPKRGRYGQASEIELFLVNEWFDALQDDPVFEGLLIQYRRDLLNLGPLRKDWEFHTGQASLKPSETRPRN